MRDRLRVWSSVFSTSIFISRPTRCSRALTVSVRMSLASLSGVPCCVTSSIEPDPSSSIRRDRRTPISTQSGLMSTRLISDIRMARIWSGVRDSIPFAISTPRPISRLCAAPLACSLRIASRIAPRSERNARNLSTTKLSRLAAGIRRPLDLLLAAPMINDLDT